jgi:hypothetical protein
MTLFWYYGFVGPRSKPIDYKCKNFYLKYRLIPDLTSNINIIPTKQFQGLQIYHASSPLLTQNKQIFTVPYDKHQQSIISYKWTATFMSHKFLYSLYYDTPEKPFDYSLQEGEQEGIPYEFCNYKNLELNGLKINVIDQAQASFGWKDGGSSAGVFGLGPRSETWDWIWSAYYQDVGAPKGYAGISREALVSIHYQQVTPEDGAAKILRTGRH